MGSTYKNIRAQRDYIWSIQKPSFLVVIFPCGFLVYTFSLNYLFNKGIRILSWIDTLLWSFLANLVLLSEVKRGMLCHQSTDMPRPCTGLHKLSAGKVNMVSTWVSLPCDWGDKATGWQAFREQLNAKWFWTSFSAEVWFHGVVERFPGKLGILF